MADETLYAGRSQGFRPVRLVSLCISALAAAALVPGCARDGETSLASDEASLLVVAQPAAPADGPGTARPPALVAGRAVQWADLAPLMAEAAGGAVLEEVVLDRLLAEEFARRGASVTPADIAAERRMLARSLAQASGVGPDEVEDLLAMVRRSRGLGDRRFSALLERNARLRRLVRDQVEIGPDDVRQAYEIRYGPRYRVRLIVVPTHAAAAQAVMRLRGTPDRPAESFAEVAAQVSTDPSSLRGGIVDPISPADPTYPAALRQVLAEMTVGELGPAVALDDGYAIMRLDEVIPASDRPFNEVREGLEAELRQVRERVLMDRLAARLLGASPIIILDEGLDWSWQARRDRQGP